MTELKTLKDIDGESEYTEGEIEHKSFWVSKAELKKEAIKWIKEFKTNDFRENTGLIRWIKDFFNITEEDLK